MSKPITFLFGPWKSSSTRQVVSILSGIQLGLVALTIVIVTIRRSVSVQHDLHWTMILILSALNLACGIAIYLVTKTRFEKFNTIAEIIRENDSEDALEIPGLSDQNDEVGHLVAALNELRRTSQSKLRRYAHIADELAVVELVASTINRTLDLQQVLDTSLRETLNALKWDSGAIYMWDTRSKTLNMVSYIGMTEDAVRANISFELGESAIGEAAQSRKVVILNESASGPSAVLSRIVLPLTSTPGELVGVLDVGNTRQTEPSDDVLNLLKMVSSHISLAIDKAQLYAKVTEHAEELEKLVESRTEQLSQAIDELWVALKQAREADRVKSLLLSTVSHELRTPLATIKGSASVLSEHLAQLSVEQLRQHLSDIEEEADKLAELITNLLDMSRLEAGTLHIQSGAVELRGVLSSAVESARVRHRQHDIRFSNQQSDIMINGDGRRIEQILANLLDNAAKYSPPNTVVDVGVVDGSQEVVVSVKDKGRGIPSEHLTAIFDRFFQVDKTGDSSRSGIGLGLSICKGLIEAQHGRIWAESELNQGATFFFALPKYQYGGAP